MIHRRLILYSDTHESAATLQIRLQGPLRAGGIELIPAHELIRGGHLSDWERSFDAVVVHRGIRKRCDVYPVLLEAARRQRIPVIHDTDDLLIGVSGNHPDHAVYHAKTALALKSLLDADVIVASTEPLGRQLSQLHDSVSVIRNELPAALWREICQRTVSSVRKQDSNVITVGYIGSNTHRPDLQLVEDALLALLHRHAGRVRFLAVGVPLTPRLRAQPWASKIRPTKQVARSYSDFVTFAAALRMDIGIAPLCDNTFNACKSDVKFQEYAALGVAGVYSDLAPYRASVRHDENGLLATTSETWLDCLERLIAEPDLRRRLAHSAAGELQATWQAARASVAWENVVQQAVSRVRSTSTSTAARHPLSPVIDQIVEYQSGLERRLKRTVGYQVSATFSRLLRKLAA